MELNNNYFGLSPTYQANSFLVTQQEHDLYYANQLVGKTIDYVQALESKLEENTNKAREYKEMLIENGIIEKELTDTERQIKQLEENHTKQIEELKEMIKNLQEEKHVKQSSTAGSNTEHNKTESRNSEQVRTSERAGSGTESIGHEQEPSNKHD